MVWENQLSLLEWLTTMGDQKEYKYKAGWHLVSFNVAWIK